MHNFLKKSLVFIILILFTACGVKGKPQPPLDPPPLGRGEPVFTRATQDIQLQKKPSAAKHKEIIKDDWDEPKDFTPEGFEEKSEGPR